MVGFGGYEYFKFNIGFSRAESLNLQLLHANQSL